MNNLKPHEQVHNPVYWVISGNNQIDNGNANPVKFSIFDDPDESSASEHNVIEIDNQQNPKENVNQANRLPSIQLKPQMKRKLRRP